MNDVVQDFEGESVVIRNEDDDLMSMRSGYSKASKFSVISGEGSVRSSKTYVSKLERQLSKERFERENLEKQVRQLQQMSSAIMAKCKLVN